jgi:polysaccharide chain length determinant protein (PEP-CTERM system associated)
MDSFEIKKYMHMAIKRKWWIIVPFLLVLLGGFTYLLITPRVYEAQTLVLVQQQKVPENIVQSTVSTTLDDRLRTITQQVESRTNLENIINTYGLYESSGKDALLEEKVSLMRTMMSVEVSKDSGKKTGETSAFTISFRNQDPKKAMDVTNALAANFMSENLKIREESAMGTSTFLSDQLLSYDNRLKEKEKELKEYQERYMGGLPEQLEANLSVLARLSATLDQLNATLIDAESRRTSILKDIAASKAALPPQSSSSEGTKQPADLASLKSQLATLESRYTPNHPDVIRLRDTIAAMEKEKAEGLTKSDSSTDEVSSGSSPVDQALNRQAREIDLTISSIKSKIYDTNAQINAYQAKVDDTPKREQELLSLNRDYNNLKELYNSLQKKALDSEISVSMEKKQKGEQFKVIDSAKMPEKPVAPDVQKIILITLVLGLGLGIGLAYLMEVMDTSYRRPEDTEKEVGLPVLVSFPLLMTDTELKHIRRNNIIAYTGISVGFVVSVIGIMLAVKGIAGSISYIKGLL